MQIVDDDDDLIYVHAQLAAPLSQSYPQSETIPTAEIIPVMTTGDDGWWQRVVYWNDGNTPWPASRVSFP